MSSNIALEARSSVEVFRLVGYENDGMRPYDADYVPYGWKSLTAGANWSSDGDIGSISIVGPSTFKAEGIIASKTLDTNTYSFLIARGKATPGGSWAIGFYNLNNVQYFSPYYSNTIWETKVYSLPIPDTISDLAIRGSGTFYVDYIIVASRLPLTIKPLNMEIIQTLTEEIPSANAEISYDEYSGIDFLGSHIKIWLAKEDTISPDDYHKVFTGMVEKIEKPIIGHTPRIIRLIARGYAKYLLEQIFKQGIYLEGYIHEVVKRIVTQLITDGLVTGQNIELSTEEIGKQIKIHSFIGEALQEIADQFDSEYYLDYGRDLHFFKRGTRVNTLNIDVDMTTEFPYSEDIENIINRQQVIGIDNESIGSDTEWTESTENWSSSGILATDSDVRHPKAPGVVSVRSSLATGGTMWIARDMGTLDLSLGGVLKYGLQFRTLITLGESPPILTIKHEFTSDGNTFSNTIEVSGGQSWTYPSPVFEPGALPGEVIGYKFWYFPMQEIEVPFNYKTRTPEAEAGTEVDWSQINTIKLTIESPVSDQETLLWIDNMRIEEVHLSVTVEDLTSQEKYGIREGKPYGPDESLRTEYRAKRLGEIIIATYKDPIRVIEDVKTIKNFTFNIGEECTLSVREIANVPVILRQIRHEVERTNFNTYLTFSKRYIPTLDRFISIVKHQWEHFNWNTVAWRRAKLPSGVIPVRSELIDFYETDPDLPMLALTDKRYIIALGESPDGYIMVVGATIDISHGYFKVGSATDYFSALRSKEENVKTTEKTVFSCRAKIVHGTAIDMRADIGLGSSTSKIKFVFDNGTLYGVVANTLAQENSIPLVTYSSGDEFQLRAVAEPPAKVLFYVNDEYEGISTGYTFGASGYYWWPISIVVQEGENTIEVFNYSVAQGW